MVVKLAVKYSAVSCASCTVEGAKPACRPPINKITFGPYPKRIAVRGVLFDERPISMTSGPGSGVGEGVKVGDGVRVGRGVDVGDGVVVAVGVDVGDGVKVGDGDGVKVEVGNSRTTRAVDWVGVGSAWGEQADNMKTTRKMRETF